MTWIEIGRDVTGSHSPPLGPSANDCICANLLCVRRSGRLLRRESCNGSSRQRRARRAEAHPRRADPAFLQFRDETNIGHAVTSVGGRWLCQLVRSLIAPWSRAYARWFCTARCLVGSDDRRIVEWRRVPQLRLESFPSAVSLCTERQRLALRGARVSEVLPRTVTRQDAECESPGNGSTTCPREDATTHARCATAASDCCGSSNDARPR
jgi:hypothetical protein